MLICGFVDLRICGFLDMWICRFVDLGICTSAFYGCVKVDFVDLGKCILRICESLWICASVFGFTKVNFVDLRKCILWICAAPLFSLLIVSTVPPLGCRHDEWPATGSGEEQREACRVHFIT